MKRPPPHQLLSVVDIGNGCIVPARQDAPFLRPLELLRRQINALQLARVESALRNVKVCAEGWLIYPPRPNGSLPGRGAKPRACQFLAEDWRWRYTRLLQKFFPTAWVYKGGRHLALHESPPEGRSGMAGPCLFRIIQIKPV